MGSFTQHPLRIGLIGAGPANFGSSNGLVKGESLGGWNHAIRLEKLPGRTLTNSMRKFALMFGVAANHLRTKVCISTFPCLSKETFVIICSEDSPA